MGLGNSHEKLFYNKVVVEWGKNRVFASCDGDKNSMDRAGSRGLRGVSDALRKGRFFQPAGASR
jgi:hypothetical protein